jgi:ferric-dicitrate binding protein FerR (iron transport regulator)
MGMEQRYQHYQLEDFLADPAFRTWAKFPTPESDQFWARVQARFPAQGAVMHQARLVVLAYQLDEPKTTEAATDQAWQKLRSRAPLASQPAPASRRLFTPVARLAASLALLAVVGLAIWHLFLKFQPIVYQTAYGEIQKVVLPDGTRVTLNANSRLAVSQPWTEGGNREVDLVGEAYFEVAKKPATGQKFVVNTADLSVVVLGTSFNVNNRLAKTRVVLREGAVTLRLKDEAKLAEANEVQMLVGELVEFSKTSQQLVKQKVATEKFSAWKDHKLIFDNTPLDEIAQLIEENYGLKVRFADPALGQRKVSGTIPNENLKVLLTSIEAIFEVNVKKEDRELVFEQ